MQPLARVRDEATTGWSVKGGIARVLLTEPLQSFTTADRQRHSRRFSQLLLKKLMKTLLTTLHIRAVTLHFDPESLLHRPHPGQQSLELDTGQPPVSGCGLGPVGLCQWERASRSRRRRCQCRC